MEINDFMESYGSGNDRKTLKMIAITRQGISYSDFERHVANSPFDISQWASFLHLSERTLHRYKKEQKDFEPLQSEKILELMMLQKHSQRVFEKREHFRSWLNTASIALGGIKPIAVLDSGFGIDLIRDELTRIEHGVFA